MKATWRIMAGAMRWIYGCLSVGLMGAAVLVGGARWALSQDRVVAYQIVNGAEIPQSLTGQPGDAEAGRKLYFSQQVTGCSGCHGSPGGPGAVASEGRRAAPELDRIWARMSEGAVRLWLVAPQVIAAQTEMPAYYVAGYRTDPNDPRYGEPRLSAAEIEDLVAYLMRAGR